MENFTTPTSAKASPYPIGDNFDNPTLTNHPDWVSLLSTVEDRLERGEAQSISWIERKCLDNMHRQQRLDGWQFTTLMQIARRIGVRP